MTSKKKLVSKLANGVRQVKLQREQAPVIPAKTVAAVKTTAKPAPTVAATRPAAPPPPMSRPASKAEMTSAKVNSLHPQRVWPD